MTEQESPRVRTVLRGRDAFNRRDLNALAEVMHPDFEFTSLVVAALQGEESGASTYRGIEGMRQFLEELEESFESFGFETDEVRDVGERVLELAHATARGRASGAPVHFEFAAIWEFTGEKVRRIQLYLDRDEALRAAQSHAAR